MKLLLLGLALLATPAARAQLLPVPNTRNPDWEQTDTKLGFRPSRPDTLPAGRDRMPIADPNRGNRAAMPNALGKKSLLGMNGSYHYWDAARKLGYEWKARPGSNSAAPDSLVTVYQQATGATYTYRRRPAPTATPRLLSPGK
ncbi:hypothetical protein HHL22_14660 [Hymenobacter sp. RP-2-7]|uniref:Uncharacterized protein n=1 Tax=Hymenobacter polaris TaxID=2682546 RepID=A0A7Y0FND0_9BACT|nr:hypothetical protein [Hymenobacter polaris]NML66451.1 hypothetical protein [Hymenobacter polaris]